jgi:hypothetical protein
MLGLTEISVKFGLNEIMQKEFFKLSFTHLWSDGA